MQSSSTTTPISTAQRSSDDPCCTAQADRLLDSAMDYVVLARLLAARSPGSGDWLEALPLSSVDNKMDNATAHRHRPASWSTDSLPSRVCLWQDSRCRRSSWLVLSLRFRSTLAPQPVNDVLCRAFKSGSLTTRAPYSLCTGTTTGRSDADSLVTWSLPGMGCDLPRHVRRTARSGQQYTC